MAAASEVKTDVKWAIALLILSLLAFSAALTDLHAPPTNDWWTSYAELPQDGNENLSVITGQILTGESSGTFAGAQGQIRGGMPLLMPFEVLGLLLTVALIGALTVAVRDKEDDEEVHGQTPTSAAGAGRGERGSSLPPTPATHRAELEGGAR